MASFVLSRLAETRILRRIALERLCEPLHLNVISVFVQLFGSFRAKVAFDLVVRQQHAFCLLEAADIAAGLGIRRITAIELGVANGAGLLNICSIARRVTRETGVEIDIAGFDSGEGMPKPIDYRDHPELYAEGDFPLENARRLLDALPENARMHFGDLRETVSQFLAGDPAPIGFVSIDLDYYSSTKESLKLLTAKNPSTYLPMVPMYVDDMHFREHNVFCGELLAINEFNCAPRLRKVTPYNFLKKKRIFTRAEWVDKVFLAHILDHPSRNTLGRTSASARILDNPYLKAV